VPVGRRGLSQEWVLGTGVLGVAATAYLVGVCTEEPVDTLFGRRIVEVSEVYSPAYKAGKDFAPVVEDS